jgi:hypothetical protein
MGEVANGISTILSDNATGVALKIILSVLFIGMGVWAAINGRRLKIEAAQKETEANSNSDRINTANQGTVTNNQVNSDSHRVDDILS